jgi:hypothetical protein
MPPDKKAANKGAACFNGHRSFKKADNREVGQK